ncbi:hypothetical protein ACJX0J_042430, partial [Zea mays]
MYSAQMGSQMGPQFTRPSQSGQTPNTNETQGSWPPPPWGYPTHPMGPWGRPLWPTQPLPSPA